MDVEPAAIAASSGLIPIVVSIAVSTGTALAGAVTVLFHAYVKQAEKHQKEQAEKAEQHRQELKELNERHERELSEVQKARVDEMARVTTAAIALADLTERTERLFQPKGSRS